MKPAKILFIEDDEVERRAFLRIVRDKNLPWEVNVAETLAAARAHLAESLFDVIVADNHLPDGESTELFGEISDIPFVLVTGTLEEQLALRTLGRGADDYLVKDVELRHLEALPFAVEKTLYRKAIHEKEQRLTRELRESEERLAAFMQNLPGAAWIKDLDGRYVSINAAAELIFGTSLEIVRGKRDNDIFPPETAQQFQENDRRVLANGDSLQTTEVLRQSDGVDHISIVRKFILKGSGGQPAFVAGVAFDVTERMRTVEALRESEARLRAILDNLQDAYFQVNLSGRLTEVSPSGVQMFGYGSTEEMIGLPAETLYADPRERQLSIEEVRRSSRMNDRVVQGKRKDGTTFWASINAQARRGSDGQIVGIEGVVRDITQPQNRRGCAAGTGGAPGLGS